MNCLLPFSNIKILVPTVRIAVVAVWLTKLITMFAVGFRRMEVTLVRFLSLLTIRPCGWHVGQDEKAPGR